MKTVLLIALVFGLVFTAVAQTSNTGASGTNECKLKLSQAPAIRGIRLGMSAEQVLAQIPGAESDSNFLAVLSRDYFGSRNATVVPGNYATSKEKFAGINAISLSFLDGRLLTFFVQYNGPEWRSKEQFVARVAEVLNLPGVGGWKASNNALALACDGFEISVQIGAMDPQIGMKDTTVDFAKVVQDRVEVPKEKARRAFKP
jgi:hypothetical protein